MAAEHNTVLTLAEIALTAWAVQSDESIKCAAGSSGSTTHSPRR